MNRNSKQGCCVYGCSNAYYNTNANVKFYNFPSRWYEKERKQTWIDRIRQTYRGIYSGGVNTWQPKLHSKVCSAHFVGSKKSNNPLHPAYNPSIFPEVRWLVPQIEALIAEFKKYPILYDPTHKEFNNEKAKETVLHSIVEVLQKLRPGICKEEIVNKWRYLKTEYKIACKKYQQSFQNGDKQLEVPNLWYYEQMEFLNEHLYSRPSTMEKYTHKNNNFGNTFTEVWPNGPTSDPLASVNTVSVKEEIPDSPPEEDNVVLEESTEVDNDCKVNSPHIQNHCFKDESDIFGEFVASQLKKINTEGRRQDAIFEIHQVLHKALKQK